MGIRKRDIAIRKRIWKQLEMKVMQNKKVLQDNGINGSLICRFISGEQTPSQQTIDKMTSILEDI